MSPAHESLSRIADDAAIRRLLSSMRPNATTVTVWVPSYVPSIGQIPVQLIPPAKTRRAYRVTNLGYNAITQSMSPVSTAYTLFVSASRAAGSYDSLDRPVAPWNACHLFLDITVNAGGGTLQIDFGTHYSDTDLLLTGPGIVQTDIFGGASAVGTYHAVIDRQFLSMIRCVATVAVANITFELKATMKDIWKGGLYGNPSTIYLGGGPDVRPEWGAPLFQHETELIYLEENASLWAISDIGGAANSTAGSLARVQLLQ
jgi:hypothetical protein